MSQPLLGTFSIPLGVFLEQTKVRQVAKLAQENKIKNEPESRGITDSSKNFTSAIYLHSVTEQSLDVAKSIDTSKVLEKSVNITAEGLEDEEEKQTLLKIKEEQLEITKDKLFSNIKVKSDSASATVKPKARTSKVLGMNFGDVLLSHFIGDLILMLGWSRRLREQG